MKTLEQWRRRQAKQQRRGQRNHQQAHQDHRRHPRPLMQPGEHHVPQPFPRKPGLSGFGERKHIHVRNLAVGQNPFARAHVPAGIAIAQHGGGAFHSQKKECGRHKKGDIRQGRKQADGGMNGPAGDLTHPAPPFWARWPAALEPPRCARGAPCGPSEFFHSFAFCLTKPAGDPGLHRPPRTMKPGSHIP